MIRVLPMRLARGKEGMCNPGYGFAGLCAKQIRTRPMPGVRASPAHATLDGRFEIVSDPTGAKYLFETRERTAYLIFEKDGEEPIFIAGERAWATMREAKSYLGRALAGMEEFIR